MFFPLYDLMKITRIAVIATFILSSIIGISLFFASYNWEYEHDTPLLHYAGMLIADFGYMPYRDFFETNTTAGPCALS
jgi:hypothetical protein